MKKVFIYIIGAGFIIFAASCHSQGKCKKQRGTKVDMGIMQSSHK